LFVAAVAFVIVVRIVFVLYKDRIPRFLTDYDYELRGRCGVLVALFYLGMLALIVLGAIWGAEYLDKRFPLDPPAIGPPE
jgi:hypothetical protein